MVRMIVSLPKPIKAKLDALRAEGTTASGLIRRLLTEFFGLKHAKGSTTATTTKRKE